MSYRKKVMAKEFMFVIWTLHVHKHVFKLLNTWICLFWKSKNNFPHVINTYALCIVQMEVFKLRVFICLYSII